jgi:hypothetical protein
MQAAPLAPTPELLAGTKPHLLKFVEITIATGNVLSFKMLLEMGRERLVDRWDLHQVDGPGMPVDVETWITELAQFYQDEFVPALESSVHLGMQIIKYDASPEWLSLVVEALIETFETCRRLDRLKSSVISANSRALNFSRPAYEVYIGIRTLATYAFMRKRTKYLKEILPRFVRLLTQDNSAQAYVPILFWPFSGRLEFPDMRGGRNLTLWNERIQSAWGSYFGTFEKFLNAASQLEFVLEFNSYVFEVVQNPQVNKLREEWGGRVFGYLPDFWANHLDPVVPLAEQLYDILKACSNFPSDLAIEKHAFDLILTPLSADGRLLFLGGFLGHLRTWQAQAMMQQRRFPFLFEWPARLKAIVDAHRRANETH